MSHPNPSLALNLTSVPSTLRPFKCKLCYWLSFSNVLELKQHNEHFHPKPFKCDKCYETSFVKLDDLNLHIERFHPKKFQCNLCNAVCFTAYADLKEHIDLVHDKPFVCIRCNSSFASLFFVCTCQSKSRKPNIRRI